MANPFLSMYTTVGHYAESMKLRVILETALKYGHYVKQ